MVATFIHPFPLRIDTVRDILIKLDMKPHMHLVEISIFSLNNVTVRSTKIMNRADKNWAHFKKWYFVTKIVLTYCSSDREKLLKFEAEGREFANNFEITRTICSNSERSEQFLVTECFFNLLLEVSQIQ